MIINIDIPDDNSNQTLMLEETKTIKDIKKRLYTITNIPPDQQILTASGTILYDDKTLSEYNIENGATLKLYKAPTAPRGPWQDMVDKRIEQQKKMDLFESDARNTEKIKPIVLRFNMDLYITDRDNYDFIRKVTQKPWPATDLVKQTLTEKVIIPVRKQLMRKLKKTLATMAEKTKYSYALDKDEISGEPTIVVWIPEETWNSSFYNYGEPNLLFLLIIQSLQRFQRMTKDISFLELATDSWVSEEAWMREFERQHAVETKEKLARLEEAVRDKNDEEDVVELGVMLRLYSKLRSHDDLKISMGSLLKMFKPYVENFNAVWEKIEAFDRKYDFDFEGAVTSEGDMLTSLVKATCKQKGSATDESLWNSAPGTPHYLCTPIFKDITELMVYMSDLRESREELLTEFADHPGKFKEGLYNDVESFIRKNKEVPLDTSSFGFCGCIPLLLQAGMGTATQLLSVTEFLDMCTEVAHLTETIYAGLTMPYTVEMLDYRKEGASAKKKARADLEYAYLMEESKLDSKIWQSELVGAIQKRFKTDEEAAQYIAQKNPYIFYNTEEGKYISDIDNDGFGFTVRKFSKDDMNAHNIIPPFEDTEDYANFIHRYIMRSPIHAPAYIDKTLPGE